MRHLASTVIMMVIALLFASTANLAAQELPRDPRTAEFLNCWNQVQDKNFGMNFRSMTTQTAFTYCDGTTQYLEVGDTNGPWGYVFKRIFGSSYATYRAANPDQFRYPLIVADTINTPLPDVNTARNEATGWIIFGVLAGILALLIIIYLIRNGLEREDAHQQERLLDQTRINNLQNSIEGDRAAFQRLERELNQHRELREFSADMPRPIVREGDPMLGYRSLRQDDGELTPSQVSNYMDQLARHLGPTYFVDHSTIEEGTLSGDGTTRFYSDGMPMPYAMPITFDNIRGFRAQAREGVGEDAKVVTLHAVYRCFNTVIEPGEDFKFTPLEKTVEATPEFPGRLQVDGSTVIASEFHRNRLIEMTLRTPTGGQLIIPTTGGPVVDESGIVPTVEPDPELSENGAGANIH